MMAFQINADIADLKYMLYLLQITRLSALVETTALPALGGRQLSALRIYLPEREKQIAIVEIIRDMDAELEVLQHRRDKTQKLKQGMMQQLLTGRVRLVETGEAAP